MKTFRNINWTHRTYDCTNIVACVADAAPRPCYVECDPSILEGLDRICSIDGVTYYGFL